MKALHEIQQNISAHEGELTPIPHGSAHEVNGLLRPVELPFQLPTRIYGAMLAIWYLRPVLQRRFPLHKGCERDFIRFLAWCAVDGRREYAILRQLPKWDEELARPLTLPALKKDQWGVLFSVSMFLYGVSRYNYALVPILISRRARWRVARAYFRGARNTAYHLPIAPWQQRGIVQRFMSFHAFLDEVRPRDKSNNKSYGQLTEEYGLDDVLKGYENADVSDTTIQHHEPFTLLRYRAGFPLPLPRKLKRFVSRRLERLHKGPSEFELVGLTNRITLTHRKLPDINYPFGVNLFGHAKGELGIGEDVRLVAQALKEHSIPFCIINVKPGADVSQKDDSVEQWIEDEPRYAINIFCMTGIEHARYALERGLRHLQGRYNIGFWPWELPAWPKSCEFAYDLVDELWGISLYTASAYRAAPVPVYPMTLPVTVDQITDHSRDDFKLPEGDYLFVYAFDANSTLTRKNPMGLLKAFQKAFPMSSKHRVGLVLKINHAKANNKEWQQIKTVADTDSRIHIIEGTLRKPEVLALYRCCDCYVSLHRAEGFGRTLAEAMLLELDLITTAFSGNMDFCTNDNTRLVNHTKRLIGPGEYFHGEGQTWADPDIEHAAGMMYDAYKTAQKVRLQSPDFSPATVGKRYVQRLYEINKTLLKNNHE